ncbi:hypothetical protein [Vibrio sp. WXL210]|uniref:hypothetical protein n=1 Tax=Vibrio sp. WXL210 TaxID=3450709 RepID=UPI003EC768A3
MSITSIHAELEQVFIKLELAGARSVCVSAVKSGAGATSLASALVERYLFAGYKTLLVDFNLFNPSFSPLPLPSQGPLSSQGNEQPLIVRDETQQVFCGIASPKERSMQMLYRDPNSLKQRVAHWSQEYDRIVFDTCALSDTSQFSIPTASIAHVTDATLLVVSGGETTEEELKAAIEQLQTTDANIVGIILNQHNQSQLADELVRVADKGRLLTPSLKQRIKNWLRRTSLFRQAV